MELAGLTELKSHEISTPGIKEFPLNLECKIAKLVQLPQPLRAIIIADVVGISIDSHLLSLDRSEVVKKYPMHEANIENPDTGLYGPSVLSGELIGGSASTAAAPTKERRGKKSFISMAEFYQPENQDILMNAIFPRPSYIVMTRGRNGKVTSLPVSGGLLMNNRPTVQIPIRKDTPSYRNIKESGEFVVSIPMRSQMKAFENLEETNDYETAGFSLNEVNQIKTKGLRECPVNVDCRVVTIEDIPGNDLVLVLARRVGLSVNEDLLQINNYMKFYSQYLYSVIDKGMVRKWGFHDEKNLSVRPLPSWGSRLHGAYWTGPEQYQAGMQFWMIELLESNYITEIDYFKIRRWISWWRNEGWRPPEPLRSELKERLTTVLKMMLWAHQDKEKWKEVHKYFEQYPYEGKWQST
jgi:flavin reductase (DIM6/NTAB) family NADH-FMN oxidoreductase RutF